LLKETEREREGNKEREKEEAGMENEYGGVIPFCNLVFPRPCCPCAAVPPSSN